MSKRSRLEGATRRDVLRNLAMTATLAGMPLEAARHVHHEAATQTKKAAGVFKPKAFRVLSGLIIPEDEVSGSAVEAGAPNL